MPMAGRDVLERVHAAVLERDPRAHREILHGGGHAALVVALTPSATMAPADLPPAFVGDERGGADRVKRTSTARRVAQADGTA